MADIDFGKANLPISIVDDTTGTSVDVITAGGKNMLATDASVSVSVGDLLGFDDFASSFFTITTAGSATDTVRVQIPDRSVDVTSTLTSNEAGDVEKTATLVRDDLNNDSTFSTYFLAKSLWSVVFILAKEQGEIEDHDDANDLLITTTGTTVVTIDTGYDTIIRRDKKVLGEADAEDPRFIRLGIYGEVGSRTKAENPINICVRKTLATAGMIVFVDETVPSNEVWYILKSGVADSLSAEFNVWVGFERDKVELFDGDGTAGQIFELSYGAVPNGADYTKVEVDYGSGFVEKTMGTDYDVEDNPTDYTKSNIIWSNPASNPPVGTDNVKVTYDAVERKQGWFVEGSSSFQGDIDAPLKLIATEFILVGVKNNSANASTVIANISGFKEEA